MRTVIIPVVIFSVVAVDIVVIMLLLLQPLPQI